MYFVFAYARKAVLIQNKLSGSEVHKNFMKITKATKKLWAIALSFLKDPFIYDRDIDAGYL